MRRLAGIALCCAAILCIALPARADEVSLKVLSAADARAYREIFAAQAAGKIADADAAIATLSDKSLIGHVLAQRYLTARGYKTQFTELKSWLQTYGDLPEAERIYKLAIKRRPNKKVALPAPVSVHWRGGGYDDEPPPETPMQSGAGERAAAKIRKLVRAGQPDDARAAVDRLGPGPSLPQSDVDRLAALVAASYLAEARDKDALALAEDVATRGRANAPQADWIAGLAAYRLNDFARAAGHFESMMESPGLIAPRYSACAFWAARSYMRAGQAEHVVKLLKNAAAESNSFYGVLAARLLGRDPGAALNDPALDAGSFAELMRNKAAHRAMALHQIGQDEYLSDELARAFGDLTPELDEAFAAVARQLSMPSLELRAAETAAYHGNYLTSLYPVPSYAPKGGYRIDPALVLAFARQESRFDDGAVSHAGARGVMQVMPATAAVLEHDRALKGRKRTYLDNPSYSMTLGQKYLSDLLDAQNGNLFMLAAAYNAGPGNLSRWMSLHEGNNDALLFIESIPAPETRIYIKRVMTNLWMYRKRFGESLLTLDAAVAGDWPVYAPGDAILRPTLP